MPTSCIKVQVASVVLFLLASSACAPQPTPPTEFQYQINVQNKDGKPIANAEVLIDVSGKAILTETTDTKGYARFFIDTSRAGQPAKLKIQVAGYQEYKLNIDLDPNRLPREILLESSTSSSGSSIPIPNPTQTIAPSNTTSALPISTSTKAPTSSPTNTISSITRESPVLFSNNNFDLNPNLSGWENLGSAQRVSGLKGNGIQIKNINGNSDVYYSLSGVFSSTRTFYLTAWCQTDSGATCKISLSASNSGGTKTLISKEILGGKIWQEIKTPPTKVGVESNLKITLHAPSAIGDVIIYDEVELFEVLP